MYKGQKVIVVIPARNSELTLERTFKEISFEWIDDIVLCDNASKDSTVDLAKRLGITHIIIHEKDRGYGGSQKSLYDKALKLGGQIIIMLHSDYQYTPKLLPTLINLIGEGLFPMAMASRVLGEGALKGGMPIYKLISNRLLTWMQNILLRRKLSEYHSGYRAFSREVLETIDYHQNSDNYKFDNEMLSQVIYFNYKIGEVTCPTHYFNEASSPDFYNSLVYGMGVVGVTIEHLLHELKIRKNKRFIPRKSLS